MAYDLLAGSQKKYTGKRTGIEFVWRVPGAAVRNGLTEMLTADGVPEDYGAATVRSLSSIRLLLLKYCLRSVDATVGGAPIVIVTEMQQIGGMPCAMATDESLDMLADGDAGGDLIDLADHILANLGASPEEKKG